MIMQDLTPILLSRPDLDSRPRARIGGVRWRDLVGAPCLSGSAWPVGQGSRPRPRPAARRGHSLGRLGQWSTMCHLASGRMAA